MADLDPSLEGLIPPPESINDDHKVYSIAVACIVLGIITVILVSLRLGMRIWCRSFGPDDWAAFVALILFMGWTILAAYVNLNAGVGKPMWEVTLGEWSLFWESILVSTFLYPSMSGTIRISTILFFQRIFSQNRASNWFLWVFLALQVGYIIAFSIVPGFICDPIDKIGNSFEALVYCDYDYFYATRTSVYVISMVFDIVLAIFPLAVVYQLNLAAKKRLSAALIFLFGSGATIASAYKFVIHIQEGQAAAFALDNNSEWFQHLMSRFVPPQFGNWGETYWIPCQVEPSIALMGMSIPAMRQFYFHVRGRDKQQATIGSSSIPSNFNGSKRTADPWSFRTLNDSEIELHNSPASEIQVPVTAERNV